MIGPLQVDLLTSHYNYYAVMLLLGIGLYMLVESSNLVKKVIGMNIFQTGIFLFFITLAYRAGASPPVVQEGAGPYVSPLPHVLILTAIVVGVSLTAVALALIIRIYSEYGTLDEDTLKQLYYD
ncbi:cation:proton antiporter subunit C [Halomicroarcula sp. GCM10025709]|uniref:cation:proton antiporter subunit C n=1 Tax=Haloarcula TaxID=2237 RepID=UPI0024C45905|nr:cation:proton antiporter subunit C [Halomicroarcula sp. YJ-61-S]